MDSVLKEIKTLHFTVRPRNWETDLMSSDETNCEKLAKHMGKTALQHLYLLRPDGTIMLTILTRKRKGQIVDFWHDPFYESEVASAQWYEEGALLRRHPQSLSTFKWEGWPNGRASLPKN